MAPPLRLHEHVPIVTARLRLVPLAPAHIDDLAAMLADPIVMRYFPRVMTRTEARQWLWRTMDRYREHGTGLLAVLRREGAETFIGDCGLQIRTFGGATHLELGYHFRREAWGHGYATEAASACVGLAWRHSDVPRVAALIRPENRPSQAVARRVGMHRRGAVLHAGLTHDVWHVARPAPREDTLQ